MLIMTNRSFFGGIILTWRWPVIDTGVIACPQWESYRCASRLMMDCFLITLFITDWQSKRPPHGRTASLNDACRRFVALWPEQANGVIYNYHVWDWLWINAFNCPFNGQPGICWWSLHINNYANDARKYIDV